MSIIKKLIRYFNDLKIEHKHNKRDKEFSSLWEYGTKALFDDLRDTTYSYPVVSFTIENIEHIDGYFLGYMGKNSVTHFKIKECPGWKFAIWWYPERIKDKNEEHNDYIPGEFFAQFELDIDKFKPSRSCFISKVKLFIEKDNKHVLDIGNGKCWVNYIATEPELAWYRNYYDIDYSNEQHVTRQKARQEYKKHIKWHEQNKQDKESLVKKSAEFIIEYVVPYFCNDEKVVVTYRPNMSPMFSIYTLYMNENYGEAGHHYSIVDIEEDEDGNRIVKDRYQKFIVDKYQKWKEDTLKELPTLHNIWVLNNCFSVLGKESYDHLINNSNVNEKALPMDAVDFNAKDFDSKTTPVIYNTIIFMNNGDNTSYLNENYVTKEFNDRLEKDGLGVPSEFED